MMEPSVQRAARLEPAIRAGDLGALERAVAEFPDFPSGIADGFEHWLTLAAGFGTLSVVDWMLARGADPSASGSTGYTPLLSAIERNDDEGVRIVSRLIEAGAVLNQRGVNDWTPLHMAAMRDNHAALGLLLDAGADTTIRTRIDDCATPEEEARNLGHPVSADLIRDHRR